MAPPLSNLLMAEGTAGPVLLGHRALAGTRCRADGGGFSVRLLCDLPPASSPLPL